MHVDSDANDAEAFDKPSVQSLPDPSMVEEPSVPQRPVQAGRNPTWVIITGVALPCIPILVILTLLLYLIYHNRLDLWAGYPELRGNETTANSSHGMLKTISDFRYDGGHAAYLVRYNPSTLTTIASWTSRIIPYLTSSIMALVAFFAARYLVQQSKKGDDATLPNSEQLALLVGLLAGNGLEPVKDTLFLRWFKKERLIHPIPAVFGVFCFITVLSILIPLVDTWFGIATHPVTITILANTTTKQTFGRQLDTAGDDAMCPTGPSTNTTYFWGIDTYWPCNVVLEGNSQENRVGIEDSREAIWLQMGHSTSTMLSNYSVGATHWIFYADSQISDAIDFVATTPAVSTQCLPMTQRCIQGYNNKTGTYNCATNFHVNLTSPWPYTVSKETAPMDDPTLALSDATLTGIAFASDGSLSGTPGLVQNASVGGTGLMPTTWPEIMPSNPIYFGTWAQNYPDLQSVSISLASDPEIDRGANGMLWFLNCTTTVASATYAWVNGSVQTFSTELVAPDMAVMFTGAFSLIGVMEEFKGVMVPTMSDIARTAALSDSMDELAATWAVEFSRTAMALGVGAFTPLQTKLEQQRTNSVVVAHVPIGPLYLLVGLKLLYVVAVCALAIGAYAFTHPAEVEVVREQLSTKGFAAALFDQPQLLQRGVVKATQEALDTQLNKRSSIDGHGSANTPSSSWEDPKPGISRAPTLPRDLEGGKARVSLAPDPEGVWRFIMLANGVAHSIEPIVKAFAVDEAAQGKLGAVGGIISSRR